MPITLPLPLVLFGFSLGSTYVHGNQHKHSAQAVQLFSQITNLENFKFVQNLWYTWKILRFTSLYILKFNTSDNIFHLLPSAFPAKFVNCKSWFPLFSPITLCYWESKWASKFCISEYCYLFSPNLKMNTSVPLKYFLPFKGQGKLWQIPMKWSEFSSIAHVSIPVKKKPRGELFPFTQKSHRLELTCFVYLAKPQVELYCWEPKCFLLFLTEF